MKNPAIKPSATMPKTIAGSKSDVSDVVGGDVGGGDVGDGGVGGGNVGDGDVGDGNVGGDGGGGVGGAAGGGGGVGGAAGGAGAQHFVEWLFVKTSKYMALSDVHPPSAKGLLAQSGHGQGVPLGKQLPPVEAQQKVPAEQSPTHDVTSACVVQSVAQRGKGSVMPVLSSPMQ